jgi:hypothetical protein
LKFKYFKTIILARLFKMHKTTTNPLRISQESLDLDDIISDLNSEVEGQSHQHQETKPLLQIEGVKK